MKDCCRLDNILKVNSNDFFLGSCGPAVQGTLTWYMGLCNIRCCATPKSYTQFEIQLPTATNSPPQGQISSKQVQIEAEHSLFLLIFIIADRYVNLSSSERVNVVVQLL